VVFTLSSSFEDSEVRKYVKMIQDLGGNVTTSDQPAPHPLTASLQASTPPPPAGKCNCMNVYFGVIVCSMCVCLYVCTL
jgi:hypothetical protein